MRLFKLLLLVCCISAVMSAGPVSTCTVNLLSNYVSNETSCQLGELIFSDFEYGPNHFPGNPGPAGNTITITPISDPGDPGFLFSSADWTAMGAGNGGDSDISYLITSATGAPIIGAVDLGVTETLASEPVKLIVDELDGQILGAHLVGPDASSIIAEIAICMRHHLPVSAIADTIHAYPSFPEAVEAAALNETSFRGQVDGATL